MWKEVTVISDNINSKKDFAKEQIWRSFELDSLTNEIQNQNWTTAMKRR